MSVGLVILSFFIGILVLLILITLHELGHFIVAKMAKAYVYEFSIGFGSRLYVWKNKETWVSIRAFPLGGYCSIASDKVDSPEERENEVIEDHRKLDYIARWKKMFFILAGPFMNLVVALILFTSIFAIVQEKKNDMSYFGAIYSQDQIAAKLILERENPKNPEINYIGQDYVIWGWQVCDTTNQNIINNECSNDNLIFDNITDNDKFDQINDSKSNIAVSYEKTVYNFINNLPSIRKDSIEHVQIRFAYKQVDKYSGVVLEEYKDKDPTITNWSNKTNDPEQKENLFYKTDSVGIAAPSRLYKTAGQAYGAGWAETFKASISILEAIGSIFTGNFSQLAGPVGVSKQTSLVLGSAQDFFLYVALISANLFVLNLLFIPPLDGYRLLENFVEMIIRKELPYKYKIIVNSVGAILFLLLFVMITIKDFIV